ncbi:MAG: hypothetical protein ABI579_04955 [Candidatus Sumerlaeota bacterium]
MPARKKLTVIIGSGFSRQAGIPTTAGDKELRGVNDCFLNPSLNMNSRGIPVPDTTPQNISDTISEILLDFWKKVFGYVGSGALPSLEDHFTIIDLATASGHALGGYSPKELRAIRRLSIHRVFQILGNVAPDYLIVGKVVHRLLESFDVTFVSLNWDTLVEDTLWKLSLQSTTKWRPIYCIDEEFIDTEYDGVPVPLLKMHGGANWLYCERCRKVYYKFYPEYSALRCSAYLDKDDFELLKKNLDPQTFAFAKESCKICSSPLSSRLATFSYRKAFSIPHFQITWQKALDSLRDADHWLIFGYSLPGADFEFKHLLKTAQLAKPSGERPILEATKGHDGASEKRYRECFGSEVNLSANTLADWELERLVKFIEENA